MVRLSFFLFGYREIEIPSDDTPRLVSLFLKLGVNSYQKGSLYLIYSSDFTRIRAYLEKMNAKISAPLGFPRLFVFLRRRIIAVLALVFSIFFNLFLSGIVWDIRVSGNESLSEQTIEEALFSSGLFKGAVWSGIDSSKVENETANLLPTVAWININRRGTVAYVEIVEREPVPILPEEDLTPSNLVADRDCIIEDIDVVAGVACVKPGDVVRAGDVLISGVIENEWGVSFVRAKGSVTAYAKDSVCVEYPRQERIMTVEKYRLAALKINIFENYINIFENYRNSKQSCDIIVKNTPLWTSNARSLPFGFLRSYEPIYRDTEMVYSDAELVDLAMKEYREALARALCDGELVKISTDGEYTEGGYRVYSDFIYLVAVGENKKIVTDGEKVWLKK